MWKLDEREIGQAARFSFCFGQREKLVGDDSGRRNSCRFKLN
jgi:hypothetical protein